MNNFMAYSKMKKTRTEIIAVLLNGDTVYVHNKMQDDVRILNLNAHPAAGSSATYQREDITEAVLEVRDDVFHENIYKLNLSNQGQRPKQS